MIARSVVILNLCTGERRIERCSESNNLPCTIEIRVCVFFHRTVTSRYSRMAHPSAALFSPLHALPHSRRRLLLHGELQKQFHSTRTSSPNPSPLLPSTRRTAWTSALKAGAALPFGLGSNQPVVRAAGEKVPIVDPLQLVGKELGLLRDNVKGLLGSGHPALDTIAKYYFQAEGKHVRPLIVLLMSQATNGMAPGFAQRLHEAEEKERRGAGADGINEPLSPEKVLNDDNPDMFSQAKSFLTNPFSSSSSTTTSSLLPTQRRLAEITEMIHVASLLHDDVIDLASTRRSAPSAPSLFGNKLTVLAGDFLLARASLSLSRLGSNEVVELVASVLANLVEGEVMQMKGNTPESFAKGGGKMVSPEIFEHYMRKTYLKTASLIAKSSRATTVLGGCGIQQGWADGEAVKDIAYMYGRNLGIAFQVRRPSFHHSDPSLMD